MAVRTGSDARAVPDVCRGDRQRPNPASHFRRAGCKKRGVRLDLDLFSLPHNYHPKVLGGVLEEECAALLEEFFLRLRQTPKPKWKPGQHG